MEQGTGKTLVKSLRTMSLLPVIIIILAVVTALIEPRFATLSNAQNVTRQASLLAIISIGQMFCVLTAGLDFSQGGVTGALSVILTLVMMQWGVVPGIVLGLLCGAAFGAINGLIIAKFKVSAFVVTLGVMYAARGLALLLNGGQPVFGLPESFKFLGAGFFGPVPAPVAIAGLVFFLAYVLLKKTRFGRYVYAIGGNPEAARLAGINVFAYKTIAYVIGGFLIGVYATVLSSRVSSGDANLGLNSGLESLAAVIIGGVSLYGGQGTLKGVLMGVVILSLLSNTLNMLRISSYVQLVVIGVVIILAVVIDVLRYGRD